MIPNQWQDRAPPDREAPLREPANRDATLSSTADATAGDQPTPRLPMPSRFPSNRRPGRRRTIIPGLAAAACLALCLRWVPPGQAALATILGSPAGVFGPGLHVLAPYPLGRLALTAAASLRAVNLPDLPVTGRPGSPAINPAGLSLASPPTAAPPAESPAASLTALYRTRPTGPAISAGAGIADPAMLVATLGAAAAAAAPNQDDAATNLSNALARNAPALDLVALVATPRQPAQQQPAPSTPIRAVPEPQALPNGLPTPGANQPATQAPQSPPDDILASARADALSTRLQAHARAEAKIADARAKAAEIVASARATLVGFAADRAAAKLGGKSFLLERYFANLSAALAHSPKTIIDHRLNWPEAPELDLRPPSGLLPSANPH